MNNLLHEVAQALLSVDAIGITDGAPLTFKSGLKSPVYIDNRKLIFHPAAWRTVIAALNDIITQHAVSFDVIAGIETAGIPHSAALAYTMRRPSVFVRKQAKEHGKQQRVEGGDVNGLRVLLIEDQVTTGGSSLSGVTALRDSGAIVEDCFAITSYGFPETVETFTEAGVRLHTLTSFNIILDEAEKSGKFSATQVAMAREWLGNPRGWSEQH